MSTFARCRIGTMIQSAYAATGNADIVRQNNSVLAGAEHRCLLWLADRMPSWVHPDHLTFIALAAMLLAGISCAWARAWPAALPLTIVWLAVNWFGDSLDGTLARVRKQERPRYGYYVDHISDSFGVRRGTGGLFRGRTPWDAATQRQSRLKTGSAVRLDPPSRTTFEIFPANTQRGTN